MPIGSFENAWADYDHTSGPALLSEGKDLEKVGAKAPNWRLVVGSEDFTRRLVSAEVTYSREGESSMRFTVIGNLRAAGYERAPIRFWWGYGTKLVPWFAGRLADPVDSPFGLSSEASAYGWATQLGARYFQNRADYGGWDLRDAVDDIWNERFGALPSRLDFWGDHSTELANDIGSFGYEISLLEALNTVLEPMQFIGYDQVGGLYTIKRSHLASLGTDEVFSGAGHYYPEDYPMDSFTFDQSMANFYDDVTVLRRSEEYAGGGGSGVLALKPDEPDSDEYAVFVNKHTAGDSGVSNPGDFTVNVGRDYVIADYPGQQEHAERERELLVTALSRGVGSFTWDCFPIDYDLGDHLTVYRHEQSHDPAYLFRKDAYRQSQIDEVGYACVVEEMTFSMSSVMQGDTATGAAAWGMTVSGEAFESERTTIRPAGSPITIDLGVTPDPIPDDPPVAVDFVYVVSDGDFVVSDGDSVVTDP